MELPLAEMRPIFKTVQKVCILSVLLLYTAGVHGQSKEDTSFSFFSEQNDQNSHQDEIRKYTDSVLELLEKNTVHVFNPKTINPTPKTSASDVKQELIASQGLTISGCIRGIFGILVVLGIAYACSTNRKQIRWKTILIGISAQLFLAIGVIKIKAIQGFFEMLGLFFVKILDFTKAGSEFLLGGLVDTKANGFIFLFQVLPTIIFFAALTSVLFYLGIIQKVVQVLAWILTKLLGISGAESLSVAGNIFLGQTEAPLLIKGYLNRMTPSEILLVMVGGMATVAGGVLAAYIGFLGGDDPHLQLEYAKHLLAASVMAAPGAVVVSKMIYPQQEVVHSEHKINSASMGSNLLDAIANGTTEGLKLAANVGAMLLVFVAFIAMCNACLHWFGDITGLHAFFEAHTPYQSFSLEAVLGILFAPLMWIIGVAKEDMMLMGQLLGIKLVSSEFIGYIQLAALKNPAENLHFSFQKSVLMATYMLCGFANFASIGIQIGGIGSLAPKQRDILSKFGLKALIGGTLASLLSATLAGMLIG